MCSLSAGSERRGGGGDVTHRGDVCAVSQQDVRLGGGDVTHRGDVCAVSQQEVRGAGGGGM